MLGAIAQFETEIRAERQMDGIKKPKRGASVFGREKKVDTETDQSAPAKAKTGRVDQNTHEGLQSFKG
jgi:DNA invertase Pin-like site-specific DNA recombinase